MTTRDNEPLPDDRPYDPDRDPALGQPTDQQREAAYDQAGQNPDAGLGQPTGQTDGRDEGLDGDRDQYAGADGALGADGREPGQVPDAVGPDSQAPGMRDHEPMLDRDDLTARDDGPLQGSDALTRDDSVASGNDQGLDPGIGADDSRSGDGYADQPRGEDGTLVGDSMPRDPGAADGSSAMNQPSDPTADRTDPSYAPGSPSNEASAVDTGAVTTDGPTTSGSDGYAPGNQLDPNAYGGDPGQPGDESHGADAIRSADEAGYDPATTDDASTAGAGGTYGGDTAPDSRESSARMDDGNLGSDADLGTDSTRSTDSDPGSDSRLGGDQGLGADGGLDSDRRAGTDARMDDARVDDAVAGGEQPAYGTDDQVSGDSAFGSSTAYDADTDPSGARTAPGTDTYGSGVTADGAPSETGAGDSAMASGPGDFAAAPADAADGTAAGVAGGAAAGAAASGATPGGSAAGAPGDDREPLLQSDLASDLRGRWEVIQQGFVDDPRNAVSDADSLVDEVLQRVSDSFDEQQRTLEGQWSNGEPSTDDLRIALQRYRAFFRRLLEV